MLIRSTLRKLLSADDLDLLDLHGDLLQGLASGEIHPSTKNQERFVYEIKGDFENAVGKSSKVWMKYSKLNEMLYEISELEMTIELKNKEIEELKKELAGMEIFAEILQLDLAHTETFEWNEKAIAKLPEDNKEILKKFERALALKDAGIVSKEKFDELTATSGLWKALHNYEKVLHPQSLSTYSSDGRGAYIDMCRSCGCPIVNGHCRCSN